MAACRLYARGLEDMGPCLASRSGSPEDVLDTGKQ